ncbi:MAG: hypothetical protein LUE13_04275 [Akkermansiaceae bacterium]|nr:hypothetical protein [Akkermansiaceae bacterium]
MFLAMILAAALLSHGAATAYIAWDGSAHTDKWIVAGISFSGSTDLSMFWEMP